MKLLVVEAETKTADYIRLGLMEAGFMVDLARNGLEGYHRAMSEPYALLILDVMLPDVDGRRIVKALREAGKRVPVLFLTAHGSVDGRVKRLELGSDDYLVKPFKLSELLARVRTLPRVGNVPSPSDRLQVGDLVLDLPRRRATRAGLRVNLTGKEFALLELLMRRQGEVLPRSLLVSQVWGMNFDGDSNFIDVAIRRLRAKIDDAFEPKLIQTVRGMGYSLDVPDAE
ncbi:two-component system copper resistance phosphate regulon response regulator CusR [Pseudomonas citronellolis]|uniref:heavy metal response regulator transcription factor n=1 Tax=Pseudomonas citronellolis TaxID=53408 RepID=UPI00209E5338|nr:heavy metal response regulator transcription factor [Pseudomonas citronellolis]MCP1644982.1 two-component system copper resistance phosphate regulon response regulator CusR [Pseudomonas citronellolis]MCP1668018.1 two-component system copper resistance phosphate regulon response regulator CusR [Pseudomonas citronellolis]MCP1699136.1 two-component system copper resistance phosphate regulon response regulator CusR [Pseudomonas citronellolis]MCP1705667.1 two-component system copper resistance ph